MAGGLIGGLMGHGWGGGWGGYGGGGGGFLTIIIQLLIAGQRILGLPIPTFYGDEISRVDGLSYAWNVLRSSLLARAQALGFIHDPKFDCRPAGDG